MGGLAAYSVPSGGYTTLHSSGQNQRCSTNGWIGHVTVAVKEGPQRQRAGNKMRIGPQVGQLLTSPCCLGGPQGFIAENKISYDP